MSSNEHGYTRKLAAIVVADVVDYSRLMSADEADTYHRLTAHRREVLEPAIARRNGRLVKSSGDGFLIDFPSVVDAVCFALDAQSQTAEREAGRAEGDRLQLRFGINLGDVIVDSGDIFGEGVNVAARLESLADPGAIYVSGEVRDQVYNKLNVTFQELGRVTVKNVARSIHVYRVTPADGAREGNLAPSPERPDRGADPMAPVFDQRPAIAVLPFENLSGDSEQEYFSDALTDDIVVGLACWRWFPVIGSGSTRLYKGRAVGVGRVGLELGAGYVLQGKVRQVGEVVMISCQLTEVSSGQAIWAERYQRPLDDLLLVQQEIARSIVAAIEPEIDNAERRKAARKTPGTLGSWHLVRRANFHMGRFTREDSEIARSLYEQALVIEPDSADALSQLAWWHFLRFWAERGQVESLEDVLRYARRALAADPRDARAHVAIGVYHLYRADYAPARTAYEAAVRLNPSLAIAHVHLGSVNYLTGRFEEAFASIAKGLRLSPFDPHAFHWLGEAAFAHYLHGDWAEALDFATRSVELRPRYFHARLIRIAALARLGRRGEAAAALSEFRKQFAGFSFERMRWMRWIPEAQRAILVEGVQLAESREAP